MSDKIQSSQNKDLGPIGVIAVIILISAIVFLTFDFIIIPVYHVFTPDESRTTHIDRPPAGSSGYDEHGYDTPRPR
jgi:hypothetical protein